MSNIVYPFDNNFAYEIKPNSVFVFPSSYDGTHGKGASYLAIHKFGARRGVHSGLHNRSYAIRIHDENNEELLEASIRTNIQLFIKSTTDELKNSIRNNRLPFEYVISDFTKELKHSTFKEVAPVFNKLSGKGLFPKSFSGFIEPRYIVNYDGR